jgi:NAD(P)H-flavin reductase
MKENVTETALAIVRIEPQTPEIALFTLRPPPATTTPARPGQVAVLHTDGEKPAYFALAHAPHETDWQILVRRGEGVSGVLWQMGVGSEIRLQQIAGRGFDVAAQRGRDLLFVAMGTGIAPLRAAWRCILREREAYGRLALLYGARTPAEFCFADDIAELQQAGAQVYRTITADGHDWTGPTGYAQHLLDAALQNLNNPAAFICGSPAMVQDTRERLAACGVADVLTNY